MKRITNIEQEVTVAMMVDVIMYDGGNDFTCDIDDIDSDSDYDASLDQL